MASAKRAVRKRRRPYHHGNLRRALLDEALATIRTEGVHGLTLRDLGARLGVSRTALYAHFAGKGALLAALATEGFHALREQLLAAWEEDGRGEAGFRSMGAAYVRFAVVNRSHYRVMFGDYMDATARNPELAAAGEGAFRALVDALAGMQREGAVRSDDTVLMARSVWAMVHGVAMLAIDGHLPELGAVERLMQYAFERLRAGLGAGAEFD